jgi:tRNA threonylcarbamoyladenosine biosynthesis protein TsaB
MHAAVLGDRYASAMSAVMPALLPDAASMLRLALPRFASGRGLDAAAAAPLYVRDKVALKTNER